jgi:hypothetical protein
MRNPRDRIRKAGVSPLQRTVKNQHLFPTQHHYLNRIVLDHRNIIANTPPNQVVSGYPLLLQKFHFLHLQLAYVPPRPPVMDPRFCQIGLPTSATRLNVATNWTYHLHPWPDGVQPQMGYPIPSHLYFSPHYRTNGIPQLSPDHQHPPSQNGPHAHPSTSSPPHISQSASNDTKSLHNSSEPTTKDPSGVAPIIDPSLNSPDSFTNEQVLAITEAAMKAVLEAEAKSSRAASRSGSALTSPRSETEIGERKEETREGSPFIHPLSADNNANHPPSYRPCLERPEPMEHILTEDGEPMLNPGLPNSS